MNKKTKKWIMIFTAAVLVCLAALLLIPKLSPSGNIVDIKIDGKIYERIDLDRVTAAYDVEIHNEYGYNRIHIEPDGVSVTDADCRDGICMKKGKIHDAGIPIICLPHHLTIELEGDDIDA